MVQQFVGSDSSKFNFTYRDLGFGDKQAGFKMGDFFIGGFGGRGDDGRGVYPYYSGSGRRVWIGT